MQCVACFMVFLFAWNGQSYSHTTVYGFGSAVGSLTVLAGHSLSSGMALRLRGECVDRRTSHFFMSSRDEQ